MFSTKRPEFMEISKNETATVIARGVRVQGDFSSQGDVQIDGVVEGNVSTAGRLVVGSDAKLKADVSAGDAVVSGSIEGTLTVKKRLELKSTASIVGDLVCETAAIEAGAIVQGKAMIGTKAAAHKSVTETPVMPKLEKAPAV